MKILLACDKALLRDMFALHLVQQSDFEVSTVATYDEAHADIQLGARYDLAFLNLSISGMCGLTGLREMAKNAGVGHVAIVVNRTSQALIDQALKLGAVGIVPQSLPSKTLLAAVEGMGRGEIFVPPDDLISDAAIDPLLCDLSFSPREMQVLQLLGRGDSNKEIARALEIREPTVKLHVSAITRKLGVRNRTQAAIVSREVGLF